MLGRARLIPLFGAGAAFFAASSPLVAQVRTLAVPPSRPVATMQPPTTTLASHTALNVVWNVSGWPAMALGVMTYSFTTGQPSGPQTVAGGGAPPPTNNGAQFGNSTQQPSLDVVLASNDPNIPALQTAFGQRATATLTFSIYSATGQLARQCTMGNALGVSLSLLPTTQEHPAGYDAKFVYQTVSCTPQ